MENLVIWAVLLMEAVVGLYMVGIAASVTINEWCFLLKKLWDFYALQRKCERFASDLKKADREQDPDAFYLAFAVEQLEAEIAEEWEHISCDVIPELQNWSAVVALCITTAGLILWSH